MKKNITSTLTTIFALVGVVGGCSSAYSQESGFRDVNGDGKVTIATFGDSLTFGIGDGIPPGTFFESLPEGTSGPGYPGRLSSLLGVPVSNGGVPGEEFIAAGKFRFPAVVSARRPDYIVFLEGTNDSVRKVTRGEYARDLQRVINVARAEGVEIVVLTLPPTVGVHAALAPFVDAFSSAVLELSSLNEVLVGDLARAWKSTCPDLEECRLYSIPEGLHPNTLGYTAIAQVVASTLLGIDIFLPNGASDLENALGLNPGDVVVRPDVAAPNPTANGEPQ
jgi:lysophospholipase L1-like esterase